jgi:hypothetical protein
LILKQLEIFLIHKDEEIGYLGSLPLLLIRFYIVESEEIKKYYFRIFLK